MKNSRSGEGEGCVREGGVCVCVYVHTWVGSRVHKNERLEEECVTA